MVPYIVLKLSRYIGNGIGTMLLNVTSGSILQWGAGGGLRCFMARVVYSIFISSVLHFPHCSLYVGQHKLIICYVYYISMKSFFAAQCYA